MKSKRKIIISVLGLMAFIVLVSCISFSFEKTKGHKLNLKEPRPLEEADILIMGDSIMGYLRSHARVDVRLEVLTDANAYNLALGGTCATISKQGGGITDKLQFTRLASSIKNNSFSNIERDADMIESDVIYYFNDVLQDLKSIDYENMDYILIHYGANDYFNGAPIEDYWFRQSEKTFKGALRIGIETIHEACPNAMIILCTPIYCNFAETEAFDGDSNSVDNGQGTLVKYAEAVKDVADEYGIYCIDSFTGLEINEQNWEEYLSDGIHPNWRGMKLYSELIAKELQEIVEEKTQYNE